MQQSEKDIFTLLDEVENLTISITSDLSDPELNEEKINSIMELFRQRRKFIEKINDWFILNSDSDIAAGKSKEWNEKLIKIIHIQDLQFERIRLFLRNKENNLRNLLKNKSLLIYSKETRYGN